MVSWAGGRRRGGRRSIDQTIERPPAPARADRQRSAEAPRRVVWMSISTGSPPFHLDGSLPIRTETCTVRRRFPTRRGIFDLRPTPHATAG